MRQPLCIGLGLVAVAVGCGGSQFAGSSAPRQDPPQAPAPGPAKGTAAGAGGAQASGATPAGAGADGPLLGQPGDASQPTAGVSTNPAAPTAPAGGGAGTPAPFNFQGNWEATGYACVGANGRLTSIPLEILQVEQANGQIKATKLQGDNCVPTGHVTFVGTVNQDQVLVHFYGGAPGQPVQVDPEDVHGVIESPDRISFQQGGTGEKITLTRRP